MRLACSTGSFPEDRWETAVAKVAWAGFEEVELRLPAEPLPPAEELLRRIRANELEVAAIHAGTLPSDPAEEAGLARIGRACLLARTLDAPLVVLDTPEAPLEALGQLLHRLDRALGDVSVDLCLANAARTALHGPEEFRAPWAQGVPARVAPALDPGQAVLAGWDPVDLDRLPALPRHVYLTDGVGRKLVPAGEGSVEFEVLAAALRTRGYGGSVSLLLQNADAWAVEPLAREIREAAAGWFS